MVNKGNHPQMALIQVSEILQFTQIHPIKSLLLLLSLIIFLLLLYI